MKKSLFFLALAVAAMTSCMKDEVLDINQNSVIRFENFVDKTTKAVTETTNNGLTKFYVFGNYGNVNVFDNIEVNKGNTVENGKTVWDPATDVVWTASEYLFAAYATKNISEKIETGVTYNNGSLEFSNYAVTDTDDLVAAFADIDNTSLTNAKVDLTFKHLLSKVKFEFTNVGKENFNYTMDVSDIKFNVQTSGTCNASSNTIAWFPSGDSSDLTFDGQNGIVKNALYTSEVHHVIPGQNLTNIKASFTITFKNASGATVDVIEYDNVDLASANITVWEPGYVYKYTANLPVDPQYIKFTASVDSWQEEVVADTNQNEGIEF